MAGRAIDWAAVREGDRDVTVDERIASGNAETCPEGHPRAGWLCTRVRHSDDIHVAGNGWEVCAVWRTGDPLAAVLRVLGERAQAARAARDEATETFESERSEPASIAHHRAAARLAEALETLETVLALVSEIKGAPKP